MILRAISNEVCQKVRDKIDLRTIFTKRKTDAAIEDIESGIQVLEKWLTEFLRTKAEIEQQPSITRWEFTNAKLFQEKPKHMIKILADLRDTCVVMAQFQAILNDQLKAVTGSQTEITQVSARVHEAVQKLATFEGDVFVSDP